MEKTLPYSKLMSLTCYQNLFDMVVRGQLAAMFLQKGVAPTADIMDIINAKEITVRDLAALAYKLDCEVNFYIGRRGCLTSQP